MKGYRTILLGLLLAIAPAALEYLTSVDWNALFGAKGGMLIGGLLMVVMRMVTTTPIASTVAKLVLAPLFGLILLMPGVARAADMPLKSPSAFASSACTLTDCSGFYVGGGLTGAGSNLDIIGSGLNSTVFGAGGLLTADAGYQYWHNQIFFAAEVFGGYNMTNNAQIGSPGNNARWLTGEIGEVGFALSGLFGGSSAPPSSAAPSQGIVPINIPAALANALISPYIAFGDVQRPWGTGWATGAGARFLIASHWEADLKYLHVDYGSGASVSPSEVQKTDNLIMATINYKF